MKLSFPSSRGHCRGRFSSALGCPLLPFPCQRPSVARIQEEAGWAAIKCFKSGKYICFGCSNRKKKQWASVLDLYSFFFNYLIHFEPYRWSMKNMAFEGSHYACFLEGSIANKAVVSVAFHWMPAVEGRATKLSCYGEARGERTGTHLGSSTRCQNCFSCDTVSPETQALPLTYPGL